MTPTVFTPAFTMWPTSASRDEPVVLRGLEHPSLLVVHRQHDGRGADRSQHRRACLRDERHDAHRIGRARRADQRVDLVLGEELLHEDDRLRRVARVVEHEVLDREIADLLRQQRGRVLLRNADDRGRAGRRSDHADLQLGEDRRRRPARWRARQAKGRFHGLVFPCRRSEDRSRTRTLRILLACSQP